MQVGLKMLRFDTDRIEMIRIHASGVLNFLLDRTALWVGGLRKVGINLQSRHVLDYIEWLGFRDLSRKETPLLSKITCAGI